MTKEDIISMAREASIEVDWSFDFQIRLERFAALVVAAEREACIDLVAFYGGPVDLEAAIRARGDT